jgi:hypothetical protein
MPSVLEPVAASNNELRSIPSEDDDVEDVAPNSADKSDDDRFTELIAKPSFGGMLPKRWRKIRYSATAEILTEEA